MNLTLRNTTASTVIGTASASDGWRAADIAGQIASLARTASGAATPDDIIFLINLLRLTRSSFTAAQDIVQLLQNSPHVFRVNAVDAFHAPVEPMQLSTFFNPSFWNDLFGGKSANLFVAAHGQHVTGAVKFGITSVGIPQFTVEARGVREGDRNPGGRLHRWGQGGFYSGFNAGEAPAIVHFAGRFHLFYLPPRNKEIHHAVSDNGLTWSPATPHAIGFSASSPVCPVVVGHELVLLFRDGSGNGMLCVVGKRDGSHFHAPPNWYTGINIGFAPAAVMFNQTIYAVAHANSGNSIVVARIAPGSGWKTSTTHRDTSTSPGLVVFRGKLHLFHRDAHGDGIFHSISADGETWIDATPRYIGFSTGAGPRPIVYRDRLYVLFRDSGKDNRGLLAVRSDDGLTFTREPDWFLGLNCATEPSPIVVDDRVFVVGKDGSGEGVMCLSPDLGA